SSAWFQPALYAVSYPAGGSYAVPGLHLKSLRGPGPILTTGHRQQAYGRDYNKLTSLALTRIPPVHHLLAGHGRRHKNALFMQCPYDLDIDAGNEVCASLLGIDQTKWSICSDITAEQPSFIQFLDHFSFRPSLHS